MRDVSQLFPLFISKPTKILLILLVVEGIVYAHRNEDIVNFGCGMEEEGKVKKMCLEEGEERKDLSEGDATAAVEEIKDLSGVKENYSEVNDSSSPPSPSQSSKRRKSEEECSNSSLLAMLMGMEEVELNKLLNQDHKSPLLHASQSPL